VRATTATMALAMGITAVAMGIVATDGTVAVIGVLGGEAAHRLLALLNTFYSRASVTQGPRSFLGAITTWH
jgi:hypothetical protein